MAYKRFGTALAFPFRYLSIKSDTSPLSPIVKYKQLFKII